MPYDYPIHSTMKSYEIKCYTGLFSLTGLMMLANSVGVYLISLVMKKYRNYISIDNLWTNSGIVRRCWKYRIKRLVVKFKANYTVISDNFYGIWPYFWTLNEEINTEIIHYFLNFENKFGRFIFYGKLSYVRLWNLICIFMKNSLIFQVYFDNFPFKKQTNI